LDAAKVLKDIGQGSPSRASDYRSSVTSIRGIPMDGDEAVAFIIQNELSRRQYENTRANAIKRNYYLYPSYHIVSEAKKKDVTLKKYLFRKLVQKLNYRIC
jgi:hypothetical protein